MKSHRHGDKLIDFNCRDTATGDMKLSTTSRQAAFCPSCQFTYYGRGCFFVPSAHSQQRFGKNASAKPRREYAPRRKTTVAATGGG